MPTTPQQVAASQYMCILANDMLDLGQHPADGYLQVVKAVMAHQMRSCLLLTSSPPLHYPGWAPHPKASTPILATGGTLPQRQAELERGCTNCCCKLHAPWRRTLLPELQA